MPPAVPTSFVTQNGTAVPAANVLDVIGLGELQTFGAGNTVSILEPRVAKFIVDPTQYNGTNQTIQSAITAASSGTTIFIRPGTYTENLTLKSGVNLCALPDGNINSYTQPPVIITGKMIDNGVAVTCSLSGIKFQTNADYILNISAASDIVFQNCTINATNHTPFNVANTSANVFLRGCSGDLGTTGISLLDMTTGDFWVYDTIFTNTGKSTTATNIVDGQFLAYNSNLQTPLATNTTGNIVLSNVVMGSILTPFFNQTWVTTSGTQSAIMEFCSLYSGTASAISVGTGTTVYCYKCLINSSNTNAVTGSGTLNYGDLIFSGTSVKMNVSTQVGGTIQGGVAQAPSAGFLGEQIRSAVGIGSSVSLSSTVTSNVTSISLTAGIWDVSGIVSFQAAGTTTTTLAIAGISSSSATLAGNYGDDTEIFQITTGLAGFETSLSIPSLRVTVTSTTTYYLVAQATFAVSTLAAYGRISATRVG